MLPENQPEPLDPAFHVIGDNGSIIIEGSSLGMSIQTNKQYLKPDLAHWPTINSLVDGSLKRNLDLFIEYIKTGNDKYKIFFSDKHCKAILKTGDNIGKQCLNKHKDNSNFCGKHTTIL